MEVPQRQGYPPDESLSPDTQGPVLKQEQFYTSSTFRLLKTQNLIHLLSNSQPNHRTEKQCKMISDLLKSEPYFANIARNQKALFQISAWIDYKKYQENQTIYHLGDPSDCFYILLKGEVTLTAPEKELIEEPPQPQGQLTTSPIKRHPSIINPLPSTPTLSKKKTNEDMKSQLFFKKKISKKPSLTTDIFITPISPPKMRMHIEERIVRIVYKGQSFGDLSEFAKRGTNAIAKQVSHLMIIRKQYIDYISKIKVKSDTKLKYQFLAAIPFFKLLYRYSLESITYFIQQKKLSYNHILYSEEQGIKFVYIIFKGQFKLFKKIRSKKIDSKSKDSYSDLQSIRIPQKTVSFQTIGPGQILGYTEAYNKQNRYPQTCVCKSQEGFVIRIDKNKFLKKILSPDNQLDQIQKFILEKSERKQKRIEEFIKRQENDQTHIRFLHTPSDRARRVKTESSIERDKSERKNELRKLSTSSNNFFNQFNQTVKQAVKVRRISVNRSLRTPGSKAEAVPSSIKDIVEMVKHQTNYHQIRKPDNNITLFEFNISKVPLHVKKKFDFLYKKAKK